MARRPLALALLAGGLLVAGGATAGLLLPSGRAADRPQPAARASPLPSGAVPFPSGAVPFPSGAVVPPPNPVAGKQAAAPASLTIPVIGVRTRLIPLGLTARGTLQVPSSTTVAGWFTGGPRPGAVGSAIIAGHIDSYRGPGVFFRLRLLRPGDRVYVRRTDGTLAVFRVYAEHMYLKDRFPTGAVYGPAPDAELRLITCGGVFDQSARSYLSNVVVYAAQVR